MDSRAWISSLLYSILLLISGSKCDNLEDGNWEEPYTWGHAELELSPLDVCPKCATDITDSGTTLMFYKKLIATLFNKQKLMFIDSLNIYERVILFNILPTQLEELEKINDPRDLDTILTEIFSKARIPHTGCGSNTRSSVEGMSIFALVLDIFKDLLQLCTISEVQFSLVALTVLFIAWYLNRRYRYGFILIILGSMFLFSFIHTYLECNRQMEIEQMLEAVENNKQGTEEDSSSWYSSITNLFWYKSSERQIMKENIRKASKINLPFCRPDHVLLEYINDLFVKQLEFLIDKSASTMRSLQDSLPLGFITAPVVLVTLVGFLISLTFQYILSPRAWAALLHRPYARMEETGGLQQSPQLQSVQNPNAIAEDRISGENLKTLLNFITSAGSVNSRNSLNELNEGTAVTLSISSGVEEMLVDQNGDSAASSPASSTISDRKGEDYSSISSDSLENSSKSSPTTNNNKITNIPTRKNENLNVTLEDAPDYDDAMQQ